jgi:hypothetical protein
MDFIPGPISGPIVWVMFLAFQVLPLVAFLWALVMLHRIHARQQAMQRTLERMADRLREN